MINLFRSAGRVVGPAQIRKVIRHCICKGAVGRVTPPKITSWQTRFNGEIIAIDVVYPFVGIKDGVEGKHFLPLLILLTA